MKTYINNVLPKKVSDLVDDSGHYTKPSGGIPASDLADGVVPVEDVQVNGTSILSNGVANVPIMDINQFGIAQLNNNGVTIDSTGALRTIPAGDGSIKGGTTNYNVIVPRTQHQATFYGLAKAAGDTTQSLSSNTVGAYTDEAKVAIQKMLGIYEAPWELIREDTFTNAEEADHIITVDANGEPLELTDVVMRFELPKQNTYAKKGYYGQVWFYINNSNDMYIAPEPGGWEQQANESSHGFMILADQRGGFMQFTATPQILYSNSGSVRYRNVGMDSKAAELRSGLFLVRDITNTDICWFTKIVIKLVTGTGHYKLYGKRKW